MAGAGAVEALELALGLLASLVRERSLGDALAVALGVVGTVLVAQLLADGVELAAQHVLALRLVHVLGDVVADLAPELDLGQRVTRPGEGALEPQLDVERLEQLDLALQRQVRRVAGRVGQGTGVLDRAQERDDAAGTARLEDLLDHDAVLACELVCVLADLVGVRVLGHGDAQCTADALALTLAELGAVQGADGGAAVAARQHRRLSVELGDHADRRELAVAAGGDDDPRGAVVANASSKAARASSLVIAIAIAMFGRITPSSRGRRGRMVVLMSVLIAKMETRPRACAFPLDTNVRSPYHRTHVRFALPPPAGLRARRSRLPRRARPAGPARRRRRARAPPVSTSCCPARRSGASRAPRTAATSIPTSRRSRAPVIWTAR